MKNLLPLKSLLSFALLVCSTNISANKIISVSDFGLKPDSRINAVPFVQKAINACKQHPGSTLVFPKGRYDFWAQHAIERDYHETNTYDVNPKILAVLLDQQNFAVIRAVHHHAHRRVEHGKPVLAAVLTVGDHPLIFQKTLRQKRSAFLTVTHPLSLRLSLDTLRIVPCFALSQFSHHSHIVKLSLHFYAHVGACPKFFHPPACKHAWAQTFVHWYQYSTLSLVF